MLHTYIHPFLHIWWTQLVNWEQLGVQSLAQTHFYTQPNLQDCHDFVLLDLTLFYFAHMQNGTDIDAQPDSFIYIYYFSPQLSKLNQLTTQQVNMLTLILHCILQGIVLKVIHF